VKLTPTPPNNVQREVIPSEIPVALTVLASGTVTNFIGRSDFSSRPAESSNLSNTFQISPDMLSGTFTVRAQTDSRGKLAQGFSSSSASIQVSARIPGKGSARGSRLDRELVLINQIGDGPKILH
jgi:hypothetical protein